jgi:hypothetical protein
MLNHLYDFYDFQIINVYKQMNNVPHNIFPLIRQGTFLVKPLLQCKVKVLASNDQLGQLITICLLNLDHVSTPEKC